MSETYRLVYYDGRGSAEPIRYIFAIAGAPYEDVRIHLATDEIYDILKKPFPVPDEWVDKVPYGKLPMLEINDGEKIIVSAKPICRYLASKFNMLTGDDFDDSKCDEYMDALADFTGLTRPIFKCRDPVERASLLDKLMKGTAPKYLGAFDRIIRENNGKNLVGNKITWADIYLAHVVDNFSEIFKVDLLENYPSLSNLVSSVLNLPAIQEWIEKRPKSEY